MKTDPLSLKGKGTGSGKLLLFGEHSAVYGEPAVGIPLPVRTTIDLDLAPCPRGGSSSIKYDGLTEAETVLLWRIIEKMTEICGSPVRDSRNYSGSVRYRSTIPSGGGYGSSAAVCAAIANALSRVCSFSEGDIPGIANRGEEIFHGTPSGIDAVLATRRGLCAIYPGKAEDGSPLFPNWELLSGKGAFIVTGTIPREKTTKELVAGIRCLKERDPKHTRQCLTALGAIAREAIDLMRGEIDCETIGVLSDRAHDLLTALGVSTPHIDNILKRGRRAGALGGKLSGAGGGGAYYLVCGTMESAKDVHSAVKEYTEREITASALLPIIEIGELDIHERFG